jgi:hypothetical protein
MHLHREGGRDPEGCLSLPHAGNLRERHLWIIEKVKGAVEAIFDEFFISRDRELTAVVCHRLSARFVNTGPVRFGADRKAERCMVAIEKTVSGFERHPIKGPCWRLSSPATPVMP